MPQPTSGIAEQLASLSLASKALPGIQTVAPAPTSIGTKGLKRVVLPLADGSSGPVVVAGDFFFVERIQVSIALSTTAGFLTPITAKTDTGDVNVPLQAGGAQFRFETPFNNITFTNPAGNGACLITVWVGFGDFAAPTVKQGFVEQSFVGTAIVASAAAYAVGDNIGGSNLNFPGFFISGLLRCSVVRARLSFNIAAPAGADVSLILWNSNFNAVAFVDHTPFVDIAGNIPSLQPPLRFPSFRSDGGSLYSYCDLADFSSEMFSGTPGGDALNLVWGLVANSIFSLANPTSVRLEMTARYF